MAEPSRRPFKLFVKPGCPWCVDVTKYLNDNGYRFEEVDVIADAEAFSEMERLSGQRSAPTMLVGDEDDGLVLPDFGVPELEAFLEENGLISSAGDPSP